MDEQEIIEQFRQMAQTVSAQGAQIASLNTKLPVIEGTEHSIESRLARVETAHVTGNGHSGTVKTGMMYDSQAAGAGGASLPPAATSANLYVMGTNNTNTADLPANDDYTFGVGPSPAGGGPYDGVDLTTGAGCIRVFVGTPVTMQADKTGGGVVNITFFPFTIFDREKKFGSPGGLIYVGQEFIVVNYPQILS